MRKVLTIDCDYLRPQFAAAFLLEGGSGSRREAAFVETNTTHSVPKLLKTLESRGLSPEKVRYIIITHVHLDHAGGASALMEACPQATLLAHPRAAPHMIDPSKLVSSARKVYGDSVFEKLYGEIRAIPAPRVRAMDDGSEVDFGGGKLRFIHTRGHANHHFCVLDPMLEAIFTGDSFGLMYPALQKKGLFIFPSTSPTDFDPAEARLSLKRISESGAKAAFLTHYGEVRDLSGAATQLREAIDFSEALLDEARKSPLSDAELDAFCEEKLKAYYSDLVTRRTLDFGPDEWDLMDLDLRLNAQGIAHIVRKRRQSTPLA